MRPMSTLRGCVVGLVGVAFAPLVALSGCSDGGDASSTRSTTTARVSTSTTERRSTTTEADGSDRPGGRCPDSDAVAEVVGGDVRRNATGGSKFSGGTDGSSTSYSYSGCDYDVAGSGDGEITIARITGSQVDGKAGPTGPELFDALAAAAEADTVEDGFVKVDGLGREAYRDGGRLMVRTAAGVVAASVTDADGQPDLDATRELAEAMATGSSALSADDVAPDADCGDLRGAVTDAVGTAASDPRSGIGGSSVGDAELDWRTCTFELDGGGEAQVGMGETGGWDAWVAAKRDSPFSASYEELTVGEYSAYDDGEVLVVDTGDDPLLIETDGDDLGPDQATLRVDLAELALGA